MAIATHPASIRARPVASLIRRNLRVASPAGVLEDTHCDPTIHGGRIIHDRIAA